MDCDIFFLPASSMAERVRDGRLRPSELLDACLRRIGDVNGELNAVVVRTEEDALRRWAEAADRAAARGEWWGALHGVPITVKESFDVAGLPTTFGLTAMRDNVAAADAEAVTRLVSAGALLMGKTNVPVQLADWQAANPVYGTTRNPWDRERSPGGSSGGSAVALAAGMSALELGSDIGGSIRMPAHFCGVWGHKPSFGLVPMRGHALPGQFAPADMSVVGPLARSARDLSLAMSLLAPPERDGAPPVCDRPLRVALLRDHSEFPVDAATGAALGRAAAALSHVGADVTDVALPTELPGRSLYETYIHLLRGATSGRQTEAEFAAAETEAAALDAADGSYRALMLRANTMSHRSWHGHNQRRHGFVAAWRRFFADFDVLLCPVASTPAFPSVFDKPKHARTVLVDGRALPSANDYFWLGLASLCFLPATTVPVGRSEEGLPIGAQIIGGIGADAKCLHVATLLEGHHQAFEAPPDNDDGHRLRLNGRRSNSRSSEMRTTSLHR